MNRGSDPDDWFADPDREELRMRDAPSGEKVASHEGDWLSDADASPPRPSWAQTIDGRVVAVAASLLALLIAGLVVGGVFTGSGGRNALTSTASRTATTTAATAAPPARQLSAPAVTLKPGDTGTQVTLLQRALASLGLSTGKLDGQYGPMTEKAVARFQRSAGLGADGILGPATLRALVHALRRR